LTGHNNAMKTKRMSLDDVMAELEDGMTIGIGGWGSRRKPMALVRAIARSSLKNLRIVSYGGPDVGLLCAAGKVKTLVYAFVSLDSIPLEPLFRTAREDGAVDVEEWDEGMIQTGLRAAAQRVPFLPMRAGLGSDVMLHNPNLKMVTSPYSDAETLVAVPALHLDVALVHMNRADEFGNAQYLGPDPYFDDLYCMAARRRFVSTERIIEATEFTEGGSIQTMLLNRLMVDGVVETPNGGHFTSCEPDYGRDEQFQTAYAKAALQPEDWKLFERRFLSGDERDYQDAVAAFRKERR
jgi:glutaconate CoA-transferase subunit A